MNRRKFLRRGFLSAGTLCVGGAGYGMWESKCLRVERIPISAQLGPEAPPKFTLAQISDIHIDPRHDEDWIKKCVSEVNDLRADVVALTGDFVTAKASALGKVGTLLSDLKAPGGVFACLGNHDQWNMAADTGKGTLQDHGIRVLNNESTFIELPNGRALIAGVESIWAGRPDATKALAVARPEARAILLAHEPDYALHMPASAPIAIQLSGHTHGGQVCLPPGIPLRMPKYGTKLVRGLYQGELPWPVYVNRGLGTILPHIRFACPPEITLVEFTNIS